VGKEIVTAAGVFASRRPFSNGVRAGDHLYVAGQLPVDGEGRTVGAGDVRAQARQVLDNLRRIVEAAGGSLADVVKTTVYLIDMADHGPVNEVYQEFFPAAFPARTTVQVAALAPAMAGAGSPFLVEIDAVAVLGRT
jgi:2-iminobutanoate/2-iminopropanoate deaminase